MPFSYYDRLSARGQAIYRKSSAVEDDAPPVIRVWMRTARHRRVVTFRTFLRTLLHDVVHHLDYTLLRLPESFHTEGFFKRESSLFRQLVPNVGTEATPRTRKAT